MLQRNVSLSLFFFVPPFNLLKNLVWVQYDCSFCSEYVVSSSSLNSFLSPTFMGLNEESEYENLVRGRNMGPWVHTIKHSPGKRQFVGGLSRVRVVWPCPGSKGAQADWVDSPGLCKAKSRCPGNMLWLLSQKLEKWLLRPRESNKMHLTAEEPIWKVGSLMSMGPKYKGESLHLEGGQKMQYQEVSRFQKWVLDVGLHVAVQWWRAQTAAQPCWRRGKVDAEAAIGVGHSPQPQIN